MNARRGQATVLVLLLGLLGLTVALSVASRSLSDLKQTTFVDSGTRGLAAAEAAIEFGLNQLAAGATPDCTAHPLTLSFSGIAANSVTYSLCSGQITPYLSFSNVTSDDVIQIDVSKIQSANTKGADIIWSNSNMAMEAVTVNSTNVLARYAANGRSTSYANFSPSYPAGPCGNVGNGSNGCLFDSSYNNGSCTSSGINGSGFISLSDPVKYKLLRIKPLSGTNAATNITVCAQSAGASSMDIGYSLVTVTGQATTANGVVKVAQVTVNPPALPAAFDYVIFSGGDLAK